MRANAVVATSPSGRIHLGTVVATASPLKFIAHVCLVEAGQYICELRGGFVLRIKIHIVAAIETDHFQTKAEITLTFIFVDSELFRVRSFVIYYTYSSAGSIYNHICELLGGFVLRIKTHMIAPIDTDHCQLKAEITCKSKHL